VARRRRHRVHHRRRTVFGPVLGRGHPRRHRRRRPDLVAGDPRVGLRRPHRPWGGDRGGCARRRHPGTGRAPRPARAPAGRCAVVVEVLRVHLRRAGRAPGDGVGRARSPRRGGDTAGAPGNTAGRARSRRRRWARRGDGEAGVRARRARGHRGVRGGGAAGAIAAGGGADRGVPRGGRGRGTGHRGPARAGRDLSAGEHPQPDLHGPPSRARPAGGGSAQPSPVGGARLRGGLLLGVRRRRPGVGRGDRVTPPRRTGRRPGAARRAPRGAREDDGPRADRDDAPRAALPPVGPPRCGPGEQRGAHGLPRGRCPDGAAAGLPRRPRARMDPRRRVRPRRGGRPGHPAAGGPSPTPRNDRRARPARRDVRGPRARDHRARGPRRRLLRAHQARLARLLPPRGRRRARCGRHRILAHCEPASTRPGDPVSAARCGRARSSSTPAPRRTGAGTGR